MTQQYGDFIVASTHGGSKPGKMGATIAKARSAGDRLSGSSAASPRGGACCAS
jgi:hypothetical protein